MPTYIQDTLDTIDAAVADYAETVFTGWAGAVTTTIQAAGVVGLIFVALNTMFAFASIRASDYLKWGIRYVIILSLATSWAQFLPFYRMLTDLPSSIGAQLISVAHAPNLNVALDAMVTEIFDFSDRAAAESSFFSISLTSILLIVLGAAMACVAILVSAFAKLGLALSVSLAPVFIGSLLFRGTSDLFTNWSRFTLGFAMIPIVLAGIMGAVIGIGEDLIADASGADQLSDAAGFLIVALGAIVMMGMVPTMVNGLAGSIVATATAAQAARAASSAASPMVAGVSAGAKRAAPMAARVGSAIGAGRAAAPGHFARAAMEDWRHTRAAQKENTEKFRRRAAMFGQQTTLSQRAEAARAGGHQQARENMASRAAAKRATTSEDGGSSASNQSQASAPPPAQTAPSQKSGARNA